MTNCSRRQYVDEVVRNYLRLPGTPLRASRHDRRTAATLYDRGIPQSAVWAAFVIAAARRALRGPQRPMLPPVRTLSYFLGALDEVLDSPPDPGYVHYVALKLQPFVTQKEQQLATIRTSANQDRQTCQNSAVSDRR